ncbi:MAG TPA: hypothetical protein VGM14_15240 [Streptosporangiaceae bacterium]
MSTVAIWIVVLLALAWVPLGALTAFGARRRGRRWRSAWLAGPLFPLTWAIWYFLDDRAAGGRATRQLRRQDL